MPRLGYSPQNGNAGSGERRAVSLAGRARTLVFLEVAELAASVDDRELAKNMRRNLAVLSRRMPAFVGTGTEDQVFGVLCLCRSLHTLRTKEIFGKAAATRWAIGEVDPPGGATTGASVDILGNDKNILTNNKSLWYGGLRPLTR